MQFVTLCFDVSGSSIESRAVRCSASHCYYSDLSSHPCYMRMYVYVCVHIDTDITPLVYPGILFWYIDLLQQREFLLTDLNGCCVRVAPPCRNLTVHVCEIWPVRRPLASQKASHCLGFGFMLRNNLLTY